MLEIDDDNVGSCKRMLDDIKKLPKELRMDVVLKDKLMTELQEQDNMRSNASEASKRASFIITDEKQNHDKSMQEQFEKCIAAHMLLSDEDIYRKFGEVIAKLNSHGIKANTGLAVIHFGEKLAENMEGLQQNSKRNGTAWNMLLEYALHAYTVSKALDNERHNGKAHKEFEDKLIELGLIEREINSQALIPVTKRTKIINRLRHRKSKDDKDDMKQPVMLEQAELRQAINEYINTGATPQGFKFDKNSGKIVKETMIEEMRRKAKIEANMLEQRKREKEKEVKEKQRIMVGLTPQESMQTNSNTRERTTQKTKEQQELYR